MEMKVRGAHGETTRRPRGDATASRALARLMVGRGLVPRNGPDVFPEVYGAKNHCDLEFVFLGERDQIGQHPAWSELAFVDVSETPRDQVARYHEDILAHVGRWGPARG